MRKLLLKTLILSTLVVVMLTLTAAAASIGSGVVHADALRLRAEPNTACETLTYFLDGTKLDIQEKLDGWYYVNWNGYEGYVSSEYVSFVPAPQVEQLAEGENPGTVATINGSAVNFREAPTTACSVICTFSRGNQVTLLGQEGDWCQIRYNGAVGYVKADYVSVGGMALTNPRGIVTGSGVNVRSGPSTDTSVLTQMNAGQLVDLQSLENGWYHITCGELEGYISADYVREYSGSTSSSIGEEAAALALSYLGTPYVYGGSSPKGFDCSGFTMYLFSQFGYSLPHSATSQWNGEGEYIERGDLQPGDLVFFCDPSRSNGKACSHVGVYLGDDEFAHAASGSRSGRKVRISSLSEDYYDRYYKGAKRLG